MIGTDFNTNISNFKKWNGKEIKQSDFTVTIKQDKRFVQVIYAQC
jgi:hypothetical protein